MIKSYIFKEKSDKNLSLLVAILDFGHALPLLWSYDLVRPNHDQNTSVHLHNICVFIYQQHLGVHLQYICVRFVKYKCEYKCFLLGLCETTKKRTFTSSNYWIPEIVTFCQERHFSKVTFPGCLCIYKIIRIISFCKWISG